MEAVAEQPDVHELVDLLTALTGETEDEAIRHAVKERLDRLVLDNPAAYIARIRAITSRYAALPILDARSHDEILGYNESGTFD